MLTGNLVRTRVVRGSIRPCYIEETDPQWQQAAQELLTLFRQHVGRRRGDLEEAVRTRIGQVPQPRVWQGLARLLEDRCQFITRSAAPPEELRQRVFQAAAKHWRESSPVWSAAAEPISDPTADVPSPAMPHAWNRDVVLREVAVQLGLSPEALDEGLFADLRSEQRLQHFHDLTPQRLLQRYNVALVQAVLLRALRLKVVIHRETPQRYRQLLRLIKFHRLVCDLEALAPETYCLHLDGPLSLFVATQKYGLQLALFVPALLRCHDFELEADLLWGPQRKPRRFFLSARHGLVSDHPDTGTYLPEELRAFVTLFRRKITDWEIQEITDLLPLGDTIWAPDYRLVHRASGQVVYLDVLGFWRRGSVERHLERLRRQAPCPFVLALGERLRVDAEALSELPAEVLRFRQMPLPEEVARLAGAALARWSSRHRPAGEGSGVPFVEGAASQRPEQCTGEGSRP